MDLPIACSLNESELRERRRTILASMRSDIIDTVSLPNGYRYAFTAGAGVLGRLADLVHLEHECCRFRRKQKRKVTATSVSIFASPRARRRVDKRAESFRQFRRSARATPRLIQSHTLKPRAQLRVPSFLAGPEHDGHVPEKSSSPELCQLARGNAGLMFGCSWRHAEL
jgi:hypothetical protein